jgi:hypothetical protein
MRAAPLLALPLMLAAASCGGGESRDMTAGEVAAELRGLSIEPGLWALSSAVVDARGPNLPREAQARLKRHRQNVRNCVTPAQAARPEATFLTRQAGSRCTYRDFSIRGGRLRGEMRCAGGGLPGSMTTTMDGQYGPRGYDVRMRMTSTGMPEGANIIIDTRTVGRRIGDCPTAARARSNGGPS